MGYTKEEYQKIFEESTIYAGDYMSEVQARLIQFDTFQKLLEHEKKLSRLDGKLEAIKECGELFSKEIKL